MYIDIHQHIIYGLDDGARTLENSQEMLRMAAADKTSAIFATSHASPGRERFHKRAYLERLKVLRDWCGEQRIPIKLYSGAEILYSDTAVNDLDSGAIPTLAGTRYVLVEFYPRDPYSKLERAARLLGNAGYSPIFAHIERYEALGKVERIRELRENYQVLMQMNAYTMTIKPPLLRRGWFRKVFDERLIDFLSTDAHNTSERKTCFTPCIQGMKDKVEKDYLDELVRGNAMKILGGTER